jgi:hypothetical protein
LINKKKGMKKEIEKLCTTKEKICGWNPIAPLLFGLSLAVGFLPRCLSMQ